MKLILKVQLWCLRVVLFAWRWKQEFLLFGLEKTLVINFLVWFLKLLLHHSPTEELWTKENILKYSNPNLICFGSFLVEQGFHKALGRKNLKIGS